MKAFLYAAGLSDISGEGPPSRRAKSAVSLFSELTKRGALEERWLGTGNKTAGWGRASSPTRKLPQRRTGLLCTEYLLLLSYVLSSVNFLLINMMVKF